MGPRPLERLYKRYGTGYLTAAYLFESVLTLVGAGGIAVVGLRLARAGSPFQWWTIGIAAALAFVYVVITTLMAKSIRRTRRRWIREGRPKEMAEAALKTELNSNVLPLQTGNVVAAPIWATILTLVVIHYHLPGTTIPVLAVYSFVAVLTLSTTIYFVHRTILRPVIVDYARSVPDAKVTLPLAGSVRSRIIATLATSTAFGAIVASAIGPLGHIGAQRLEWTTVTAVGISIVLALALTAGVTGSIAGPVSDLLAGTARIRAGDLQTAVPVTTADEVGHLAVSFNAMLAGLRERELLRIEELELNHALERAVADVRASQSRLLSVADEERRRMERDLHAGAQQTLVLMRLDLQRLRILAKDGEALQAVAALDERVRIAIGQLRDFALGIYPASLSTGGLEVALGEQIGRYPDRTTLVSPGVGRLPTGVEVASYLCCAEALTNAIKHAGPEANTTVRLQRDGDVFSFEVADDGVGFDVETVAHSAGMQNMFDRVSAVGGDLAVRSVIGQGTTVRGTIRLRHPEGVFEDA